MSAHLVIGHNARFVPGRQDQNDKSISYPPGYGINTHLLGILEGKVHHLLMNSGPIGPEDLDQTEVELEKIEKCTPVGLDINIETYWPLKVVPPRHPHPVEFAVMGWFCSYVVAEEDERNGKSFRYPPQVVPCLVGERVLKDGRRFNEAIRLEVPGAEEAILTSDTDLIETIKDTYDVMRKKYLFRSQFTARKLGRFWVFQSADAEPVAAAG